MVTNNNQIKASAYVDELHRQRNNALDALAAAIGEIAEKDAIIRDNEIIIKRLMSEIATSVEEQPEA